MKSLRKDLPQPIQKRHAADADGWDRCEHLNKSEAEMLLDWLEANGYSQREVAHAEDGGFTVRWRR
jgi:hypothetical protein